MFLLFSTPPEPHAEPEGAFIVTVNETQPEGEIVGDKRLGELVPTAVLQSRTAPSPSPPSWSLTVYQHPLVPAPAIGSFITSHTKRRRKEQPPEQSN